MNNESHLLPFLWLRNEGEEDIRRGVREIAASGCGSVCAESRTHPDYLGPGWWRDMDVLLDECKKQGLGLWLLDDTHFPSGFANGAAKGTPYCRMMMTENHMDVIGPQKGGSIMVQADGAPGMLAAVVAGRRLEKTTRVEAFVDIGGWALDELVDLTAQVRDGMVAWDVPDGVWRVFVLTANYVSERNPPQNFVNPLLPEGGRLMIDTVYEAHYAHMGAEFGKTFKGFFSDEPALRAGRGCRAVLGEYPMLPIPWRMDLPEILSAQLGKDARRLLPGLWYDIGEDTPRIRYALMDTVSRLYGENYSMPIGQWCRGHGVEYIGHVIEQNNAHSRLGQGAGHFFRAMSGQDMAGMDFVLHELRPEFRDTYHAWKSQDFEAEDDFFRYMLPQMTVSCARLDPKKKGRSLCEIFGAYGWQEDVGEMRYLANLLLSRGINHFTPHAFSLRPFPDPDSPPHFGSFNPLMPSISRLFGRMERVAAQIDGGQSVTRVGVLYYAEAEWAGGSGCMKTQRLVKVLNQRQLECEIVPIDLLEPGRYDALLIPTARLWPEKLFHRLRRLMDGGCRVAFVGGYPEGLSEGQGDMAELVRGTEIVPLEQAAAWAAARTTPAVVPLEPCPEVHCYPYRKDGRLIVTLFNEDTRRDAAFRFAVPELQAPVVYDPEEEACHPLTADVAEKGTAYTVILEPGQLLMVADPHDPWPKAAPTPCLTDAGDASPRWRMTFSDGGMEAVDTDEPFNITARYPRFSGTACYEAEIDLPEGCRGILLKSCSGAVSASLDGEALGERVAPPYRFAWKGAKQGTQRLRLEITNALVFAHRDPLSFYNYIKPTGLTGPVTFLRGSL